MDTDLLLLAGVIIPSIIISFYGLFVVLIILAGFTVYYFYCKNASNLADQKLLADVRAKRV
jgi:ABC-type phosphate transport system permease subunit